MSKYTVHCMKFNTNKKKIESEWHECISGSALYKTLYDLKVHTNDLLNFNEISMFNLERLIQNKMEIRLKSDKWERIFVTWFPGEIQTIPHIALTDTDYPLNYDGYTPLSGK